MESSDKWMIALTAIIAISTVVNVVIFYKESEESARQIGELASKAGGIVDSMNTALSNNQSAIKQAFEANGHALESSQRQSKSALDASIKTARDDQREGGAVMHWDMLMSNSGRSPALNGVKRVKFRFIKKGEAFDPEKEILGTPSSKFGVLQPAGQHVIPGNTDGYVSQATTDDLISGAQRFYVFGRFDYTDVFDRPHWTKFCMFLDTRLVVLQSGRTGFGVCDFYNDAH